MVDVVNNAGEPFYPSSPQEHFYRVYFTNHNT